MKSGMFLCIPLTVTIRIVFQMEVKRERYLIFFFRRFIGLSFSSQ